MAEMELSMHCRGRLSLLSLWLPPSLLAVYLKLVILSQLGLCYGCFWLDGQGWERKSMAQQPATGVGDPIPDRDLAHARANRFDQARPFDSQAARERKRVR